VFVDAQKYLQISIFSLRDDRGCSLMFTWVGVKLVSTAVGLEVLAEGWGRSSRPLLAGMLAETRLLSNYCQREALGSGGLDRAFQPLERPFLTLASMHACTSLSTTATSCARLMYL
jgi:hypothetical protein